MSLKSSRVNGDFIKKLAEKDVDCEILNEVYAEKGILQEQDQLLSGKDEN